MRRVFTFAAHSGLALAPLTSSTETCASRAVGAVTFGVLLLLPPPQAAAVRTPSSAATRAIDRAGRRFGRDARERDGVRFIRGVRFIEESAFRTDRASSEPEASHRRTGPGGAG